MSFVITPELVGAAAGQLTSINAALNEAAAAASAPTSSVATAAADEVSAAISQLFGAYGREFQAANAQAAAFHAEFVRLLNGGAAAYVSTEIANAERNLLNAINAPVQTLFGPAGGLPTAEPLIPGISLPIPLPSGPLPGLPIPPIFGSGGLGGLLGGEGGLLGPILFGGTGGLLGPLIGGNGVLTSLIGSSPLAPYFASAGQQFGNIVSSILGGTFLSNPLGVLLPGLFPPTGGTPTTPTSYVPGNAWARLFANTGNNLVALNNAIAADPFPLLRQVIENQQGYAAATASDFARTFANLDTEIAYLPLTIENGIEGLASFNALHYAGVFANGTAGAYQTIGSSLTAFNSDFQANLVNFPADWSKVGQAIAAGDYHLAVTDGTSAVLNLFLNGFDTSNLSDIKLLGPVGDLFPILSLPGQQAIGLSTLMTPHSVPQQMTANLGKFYTALANTAVSTTVSTEISILPPNIELVMAANFGLPLSLLFGVGGAPVAAIDGLATAGTVIGGGIVTGNPVQIVGGFFDAPAFILDGLLNGETIVDVPLPVTIPVLPPLINDINIPVVAHLPFNGLLVPPHPLTATIPLQILGNDIPINLTLGGTKFGGLFQLLVNTGFRTLADSIAN
ncbi:PE family protein [Mycobacterium bourgelatii]|uniref:PE domain-containing protein n=1 Tax=Mycobacterium bourgelatii TaxID=1273442 RepID=A0A7I9YP49_MYCBU|nr:PE family protein [Mycobacterium bourgelatii]MCV6975384.1 PE family protein [Mycobacterium bourgelatii]GFG90387.1 hypothetical protein MBOU_24290 [Mycobacterium bourgelatii]